MIQGNCMKNVLEWRKQINIGVSNALNSRPKKHLPIRRFPDGAFLQPLLEGLFSSMHFVLKLYANGYEKREINN
jgi:hypothetical protein